MNFGLLILGVFVGTLIENIILGVVDYFLKNKLQRSSLDEKNKK